MDYKYSFLLRLADLLSKVQSYLIMANIIVYMFVLPFRNNVKN